MAKESKPVSGAGVLSGVSSYPVYPLKQDYAFRVASGSKIHDVRVLSKAQRRPKYACSNTFAGKSCFFKS